MLKHHSCALRCVAHSDKDCISVNLLAHFCVDLTSHISTEHIFQGNLGQSGRAGGQLGAQGQQSIIVTNMRVH